MEIVIHNKHRNFIKNVEPKQTNGSIHIYGGGSSGYKLSIGNRHLTLAELAYVVNIYNANIS